MTYRLCLMCGMESEHDGDRCLFCEPRFRDRADLVTCKGCGTEFAFDPKTVNKAYCTRKCRQRAWWRTDAGRAWEQERQRRQNEKRAYLRELGIRRNSRLENAA